MLKINLQMEGCLGCSYDEGTKFICSYVSPPGSLPVLKKNYYRLTKLTYFLCFQVKAEAFLNWHSLK